MTTLFTNYYLQTNRTETTSTNHSGFCRSHASENRPLSKVRSNRSLKSQLIFGVRNQSRFRMTHVCLRHKTLLNFRPSSVVRAKLLVYVVFYSCISFQRTF